MLDVQTLVDDAAFVHADVAIALHEATSGVEPSIDLAGNRAIYRTPSGERAFTMQLIGVEHFEVDAPVAPGEIETLLGAGSGNFWEWGWARADLVPPRLLQLASFVREIGTREHIAELAAPRVELGTYSAAHLVIAAKTITGRIASVAVPGPVGTRVHLMLDVPAASPGVRQASAAITAALAQGLVRDHRRGLRSYAHIAHLTLDERDPAGTRLVARDGRLDVAFDERDRITRIAPTGGEGAHDGGDDAQRVPPWVGIPSEPAHQDAPKPERANRREPRGVIELGSMPRLRRPR